MSNTIKIRKGAVAAIPSLEQAELGYATDTDQVFIGDGAANHEFQMKGTGAVLADGSVPLTANWDVGAYTLTALRFISDQATGTAPFTVASTTVVANLNASLLEGNAASAFQTADAELTALAGLTFADDKIILGTGAGTVTMADCTAFAQTILDDADASTVRGTIDVDQAGQIVFPAAVADSADANTLDDYEEGTWTPDIQFGGAKVGITYGTQSGYYTKIGNVVFCTAHISMTSKGSSTGVVSMHGLPFTVNSNHAAYAGANFRMWNIKFDMHPQGNVVVNTTQLNFTEINGTSGTASDLTNADFANNSGFQVEVFYRVA